MEVDGDRDRKDKTDEERAKHRVAERADTEDALGSDGTPEHGSGEERCEGFQVRRVLFAQVIKLACESVPRHMFLHLLR